MIIDCHVHLGRNEHINSSVTDLLESMDKASIDKSFVFAGEINDAPNDWVLKEASSYRDRLEMVAAIHPLDLPKNLTREEHAKSLVNLYGEGKIKAVKFYTGYDHYYPNGDEIKVYLNQFSDVGCPVIFHCGDCLASIRKAKIKFAHPLAIDDIAVDYPNINFIIAHMAFPWQRDAAEVCYKNPNVYSDISGFVYGEFSPADQLKFKKVVTEFLDIAGSDKLLFGTDFPISNQKSYVKSLNDCFGELLTAQSLTLNIQKAFKLK